MNNSAQKPDALSARIEKLDGSHKKAKKQKEPLEKATKKPTAKKSKKPEQAKKPQRANPLAAAFLLGNRC